jgi:hypothetical protein
MKRLLGLITLIAAVPSLWAGEAKEYPAHLEGGGDRRHFLQG